MLFKNYFLKENIPPLIENIAKSIGDPMVECLTKVTVKSVYLSDVVGIAWAVHQIGAPAQLIY